MSSTVTISAFFTVSIIYNAKASEAEKITDANNSSKVAQQCKEFQLAGGKLVSLAAVFSIVTQRSSPQRCVTILKTAARETRGKPVANLKL